MRQSGRVLNSQLSLLLLRLAHPNIVVAVHTMTDVRFALRQLLKSGEPGRALRAD